MLARKHMAGVGSVCHECLCKPVKFRDTMMWCYFEGQLQSVRERTAYCGCGRAGADLHLERAAVENMLVEQFLPPHSHCSAGHLRTISCVSRLAS